MLYLHGKIAKQLSCTVAPDYITATSPVAGWSAWWEYPVLSQFSEILNHITSCAPETFVFPWKDLALIDTGGFIPTVSDAKLRIKQTQRKICVCLFLSLQKQQHYINCFYITQSMHHHLHDFTSFLFWTFFSWISVLKYCSASLFVSVSAGAEATGPPADGGQVLSGEKWWVAQTQPSALLSVITTTIYSNTEGF